MIGVRSRTAAEKAALHLGRFVAFLEEAYGHDRISTVVRRDVQGWQKSLVEQGLAPSAVNNHLASLSAFTTWMDARAPNLFPSGDPAKGIKELRLPPLEPRALSEAQVRSLKNVCDRLERFHELKGREWKKQGGRSPAHARGRPVRDRAIVFVLLSTGLRREELTEVDRSQVEPSDPERLRSARRVRIRGVKGKGGTERNVFLSKVTREALAEYLERIGRWHDAETTDPARKVSLLRPHDLRHIFAYRLAAETNKDAYELERRLGHGLQRYTNRPEDVAAGYVERF